MLTIRQLLASVRLGSACLTDEERPPLSPPDDHWETCVTAEESWGMMNYTRIKIIKNESGIFINNTQHEVIQITHNGIQLRLYLDEKKFYMIFDGNHHGRPCNQISIAEIHRILTE